jgi:predicted Holliday junction resolvase-like endonuclease
MIVAVLLIILIVAIMTLLYILRSLSEDVSRYQLKIYRLDETIDELYDELEHAEEEALERANEILKKREKFLREDAIRRSQAVLRGKIAEQLAPSLEGFTYNPRDCRFLGSPFDYLVFSGLTDGEVQEIVLLEVKTGRSRLSKRERQVRDAVERGDVRYETFRPE